MSNIDKENGSSLADTAKEVIQSGDPIKIIGGIALAAVAVSVIAINAISGIAQKGNS